MDIVGGKVVVPGGPTDPTSLVRKVFTVAMSIAGVVAVAMIMVGGYNLMLFGGESPDKASGGQKTIMYGIIGLVVVASASLIANFVARILWGGNLYDLDSLLG